MLALLMTTEAKAFAVAKVAENETGSTLISLVASSQNHCFRM